MEVSPLVDSPSLKYQEHTLRNCLDYYELNELRQILSTACLLVIAYLSGMRSEECRSLKRGCCTRLTTGSGANHYEIRSTYYKGALDVEGNTIPGGKIRDEPWYVIKPVADAIKVMEEFHDREYLFSAEALQTIVSETKGYVMSTQTITWRIKNLIKWCNKNSVSCSLDDMKIPDDPSGPITMSRFRRTLAWFVYRQPAGRISLGIQYGHLQGTTSDGYGSRVSTGLRDIFPMEEAFSRAEVLSEAAERLASGEFVSGPAAQKYIGAVEEFAHRFRGKHLSNRQASELQRDPTFKIYDNGLQPLACCYDSKTALCHPDRDLSNNIFDTPNLNRCDSRCLNAARTDSHIDEMKIEKNYN